MILIIEQTKNNSFLNHHLDSGLDIRIKGKNTTR